jgi:hypothetical protein
MFILPNSLVLFLLKKEAFFYSIITQKIVSFRLVFINLIIKEFSWTVTCHEQVKITKFTTKKLKYYHNAFGNQSCNIIKQSMHG